MKKFSAVLILAAAAYASACGGAPEVSTNEANLSSSVETAKSNQSANSTNAASGGDLGVARSHGRAPATTPSDGADKPPVATPELDAKIEKAEEKANSPSASAAAKKALAEAYFERANFFRDAGNPRLYKFALADYRRGLRLDPDNREARAKMDEIVMIYESMGKPVPQLGVEP